VETIVAISYPNKPPSLNTAIITFFQDFNIIAGISAFISSWCGVLIYRITFFGLYDNLSAKNKNPVIQFLEASLIVNVAGAAAYPLDTIRRCVLLMPEKNIIQVISYIYKEGGILGFYSGFGLNVLRTMLATSLLTLWNKISGH